VGATRGQGAGVAARGVWLRRTVTPIGHNEFAKIMNQHIRVLARPAGIFQLLELFGLKGKHSNWSAL
jgi:hypothetical protein